MDLRFLLLLPLAVYGCRDNSTGQTSRTHNPENIIQRSGKTIEARFSPPKGYEKKAVDKMSFAYYLRHLPLKEGGAPVFFMTERKSPTTIYTVG